MEVPNGFIALGNWENQSSLARLSIYNGMSDKVVGSAQTNHSVTERHLFRRSANTTAPFV